MAIKNAFLVFVSAFLSLSCLAQRDPIAVIINSNLDDNINEEFRSYFSELFLQNGFRVVERKQLDLLFLEYEDQKKEDYLDGQTIKIKLEGAKYYCFVDVYQLGEKLKVYYFFTDIFQERILFSDDLSFSLQHEILAQFNSQSEKIVGLISINVPLNLYYYSSFGDQEIKLLIDKSDLKIGSKIYGIQNDIKVCEFELIKNLTSNMVQCKLTNFNKKDFGKSKDFDFSTLKYQIALGIPNSKKPVVRVNNSCPEQLVDMDLIVGVNKEAVVIDNIHSERLRFEQDLQRNELFMDGESYYTLKQSSEFEYKINLKKQNGLCACLITQNDNVIAEYPVTDMNNLAEKINVSIK